MMLGLDSEQISEVWPKLLLVVTEVPAEVAEYCRNNVRPFRYLGSNSITPCKLLRMQASDISIRELLMAILTWKALKVYFRNCKRSRVPVAETF